VALLGCHESSGDAVAVGETPAAAESPKKAEPAAKAAPAKAAAPGNQASKPKGQWPMWGGTPDRNMVSDETGLAAEWDIASGKNIKWTSQLGSQSYGNPTILNGRIYVGTNNNAAHNPNIQGDKGVVLCLNAADGKVIWQATHDKLEAGRVNDWPEQGICSSPAVEGDRIWYVSNRCQLVCADVQGFADGENDGPYQDEKYKDKIDADFVWVLDMMDELNVFPHNLATSSPLVVGDVVFIVTGNGVDEGHLTLPSPMAPSFLAVDKKTGEILWEDATPGENVLHGQWSNPAYGRISGKGQVYCAGGDGWIYAFDEKSGEVVWKFDGNPKDSVWELGGRGTRNNIIATPVFYDNKVFVAVGQDPEHGEGLGHLYCIDATKTGDVTDSAQVWHFGGEAFGRTISTVAIKDGLLYASDLAGFFHCLDVKTGKPIWMYDVKAAVWGSPMVADGKVYLGDEDGDMVVLQHGREMKLLAEMNMDSSVYSTPVPVDGVLYVMNRDTLFAIEQK
jgi:outer membrane protein assembly factor BamB